MTVADASEPARPAVFLDRDGTLIDDAGYLADPGGVRLLPDVARALRDLERAGFARIVITNQSGIGRGRYSVEAFAATEAELDRRLRADGASLDAVYYCPHTPEAGCLCRKPGTALFREAIAAHQIDVAGSWCVGDRVRDVAPAAELGCHGLLIAAAGSPEIDAARALGAEVAPDLAAGTALILRYL